MKTIIFFTLLILSSCDIGGHSCEDDEVRYLFDNQGVNGLKAMFYINGGIIQHFELEDTDELICLCGNECSSSIQTHANNFSAPLNADSVVFILDSRYINFVSPRIDEVKYNEQKQASYFNPHNWIYAYEFQLNEELFEVWGEER